MSRTHLKNHCPRCQLREVLCVCGEVKPMTLATRVVFLMHCREIQTTTNTARLATLCLPNSEIRLRGIQGQPMSTDGLVDGAAQPVLLYPAPDSMELTPTLASSWTRPLRLIVPDGTWRQASKVAYRESILKDVPRIRLPEGPPSRYRLRKGPNPSAVSTIEAVARALGILEGAEVRGELERVFELMVVRTLWSKAKLRTEECDGMIPPRALELRCRGL